MDEQSIRYELTPSQKGMADLHEFYEGTSVATLCGAVIYDEKMKPELIDEAVRDVIRRHEAIRLRITKEEGRYVQRISDEVDETIEHLSCASVEDVCEFGKKDGRIMLMDEVHTPDSSRYFYAEGYEEKFAKGEPQKQLSKEFVRQWLIDHNFMNQPGQVMPEITDEYAESVSERYIELYEHIIGEKFVKETSDEDIAKRIEKNVLNYLKNN